MEEAMNTSGSAVCLNERQEVVTLIEKYGTRKGATLYDGTIPDMEDDTHVYEVDTPKRWAEAVGQALHYSAISGKRPAIVLLADNPSEQWAEIYRCAHDCGRHHIRFLLEDLRQVHAPHHPQ